MPGDDTWTACRFDLGPGRALMRWCGFDAVPMIQGRQRARALSVNETLFFSASNNSIWSMISGVDCND